MIISIILLIFSFLFEGFISNYISSSLVEYNIFSTLYTLITLTVIYPYFYNKKKYYILLLIFSFLIDIVYTNTLILNVVLFIAISLIVKFLNFILPENILMVNIMSICSVILYHILSYIILTIIFIVVISICLYVLYVFNYIPHKKYTNSDFNIETYTSNVDKDNDGIDDQSDILIGVRKYIATAPKYKSKYYASGYSDDEYGVCTDVIANGLLEAGYNIMELVNSHIEVNRNMYDIKNIDKNIDFRRVKNLKVYFKSTAIEMTTDIYDIDKWQGGDIVIFNKHIGIVSDKRNRKGIPFVIHHANPYQRYYEEDILEYRNDIVGHYRIS